MSLGLELSIQCIHTRHHLIHRLQYALKQHLFQKKVLIPPTLIFWLFPEWLDWRVLLFSDPWLEQFCLQTLQLAYSCREVELFWLHRFLDRQAGFSFLPGIFFPWPDSRMLLWLFHLAGVNCNVQVLLYLLVSLCRYRLEVNLAQASYLNL